MFSPVVSTKLTQKEPDMLMKLSPWQDDAAFLVLLPQFVVSLDVAVTIADTHPGATVIRVSSVDEALAKIEDLAGIEVAFIDNDCMVEAATRLVPALTARGARIVVIGPEDGDCPLPAGCEALSEPFMSSSVAALVERSNGRRSFPYPVRGRSLRRMLRAHLADTSRVGA